MYDPNDYAARGPQITARPGTKRHLKQTIARATFFAVLRVAASGETRRLQAKLDAMTSEFLSNATPAGNA